MKYKAFVHLNKLGKLLVACTRCGRRRALPPSLWAQYFEHGVTVSCSRCER